jgi:4-diphosphocytidyl-2-C-methyl-D-erythritol kinase
MALPCVEGAGAREGAASANAVNAVKCREVAALAPAKVNLYLGVHTECDARGYHRVDSVMHTIALGDVVTVRPAAELSLTCDPEPDCPPQQNTCWRAAERFFAAFAGAGGAGAGAGAGAGGPSDALTRAHIHVEKRIPAQAGLGGGSTDAAATLVALAQLFGVPRTSERLVAIAREVGADVPFFLAGPCAYLDGAGDTLARELPALAMPLVLVMPQSAGITAAGAYAAFDTAPIAAAPLDAFLRAFATPQGESASATCGNAASELGPRERAVAAALANNLDPIACELRPAVAEVKAWLAAQDGVVKALVTGSGACCYAVCATQAVAERIASAATSRGYWSCPTHTLS